MQIAIIAFRGILVTIESLVLTDLCQAGKCFYCTLGTLLKEASS